LAPVWHRAEIWRDAFFWSRRGIPEGALKILRAFRMCLLRGTPPGLRRKTAEQETAAKLIMGIHAPVKAQKILLVFSGDSIRSSRKSTFLCRAGRVRRCFEGNNILFAAIPFAGYNGVMDKILEEHSIDVAVGERRDC
jgi:hypothetical protein